MSAQALEQFDALRSFMFARVYRNPIAKREESKAKRVVEELYRYYLSHMESLPPEFLRFAEEDGSERAVADYIACMTDNYAVMEYERLFVPKSWN